MEGSEFPGFQTSAHKDEFMLRRPLSRLQRSAPRPLQVKPVGSVECKVGPKNVGCNCHSSATISSSSSSSASASACYYYSSGPIPLLSPLVLPCFESACIQEGNTAQSHRVCDEFRTKSVGL